MTRFLRFLGVQAGEGPIAGGLFAYALLIGVGRVFVLTASQALFLEFYPASDLAYVYLLAAAATVLTSAAYLRLGRRLTVRRLIVGNLIFTLGVTVLLRVAFTATAAGWPAMALAAWFHVMFALTSFAFWGAATQVVDIRQGKRLFPVATTGDVIAFSLGGFLILRTVHRLGTANLLWIGALGFALSTVALLYTLARSSTPLGAPRPRRSGGGSGGQLRWSSPYLRRMTAYFALSAIVFIFLDNAFNDVAQRRFSGGADLARFFGTYSAVAAVVNFFFRSLAAGRLVRRFGLVFGLAVLPAAVGIGAAGVGLGGTLAPGLALVFWITTATRLSDKVLRGVQQASAATLYQPLGTRGPAVQTTMDGIVDALAIGAAGLALLGLNRIFEVGAVQLSYFLLVLCAVWVVVAIALKHEFVNTLGGALQRRRLRGDGIDLIDEQALDVVRGELSSEHPEEVVYALGLLSEAEDPRLPSFLEGLLDHASDDVRLEALRLIAELRPAGASSRVAALARDETASGTLRGAAAGALAQISVDTPEEVLAALESEDPERRHGAMVGLLRSGSIEGVMLAGARLLEDLGSERAEARVAGAEVLRDAAIPSLSRQTLRLLGDPDPVVRARAVEAAAAMDHPELWPVVIEILREGRLAPAASKALLAGGSDVIPALVEAYGSDPDDRSFRLAALKILGLTGGEDAVRALLPMIEAPDRAERTAVLTALAHCRLDAAPDEFEALERQLGRELAEGVDAFAALGDLEELTGGETIDHLADAVREEIRGIRQRIFLLLSFLRPGSDLLTAWENYATGTRERRAYALELLDSHLSTRERGQIFPLLEEQALEERLDALARHHEMRRLDPDARVAALAAATELSPWTRLCARRALAEQGASDASLEPDELQLYRRTNRLQGVELFEELPGAVLARTVPRLQATTLAADRPVFQKGDPGDGMYVILEGRVRVHDDGRELAILAADQVFGEFTVLQRMPRTASVTTLEQTVLLKFTQEDLYELIREQVGVARALIDVIVRRLRSNRQQVSPAAPAAPG